jgi:flagellar biosynthesis protein FlhF
MRYAVYEGKTKQEAVDKMFMAARMENRVKETMLIRTYPEERRRLLGLKKETVWIATACINESRLLDRERKPSKRSDIQLPLFKDEAVEAPRREASAMSFAGNGAHKNIPIGPQSSALLSSAFLDKNKKLEEEVETLKSSLTQIQNFIKSEFDEIKEGLMKTSRNTALENKKKIMQDLEISQKNIEWTDEFLREREFHPAIIKDIIEYLKTQKNGVLIDKAQILIAVRDFLKGNIHVEDILMENYNFGNNILFIGPTGVGKTVTIIKMAAHVAIIRQKNLRFISIDRYKVGADSQLKTYADLMKSSFHPINKQEEFFELLSQDDTHYTFIDTAGRSPRDTIVIKELADWLKKAEKKFDVHLVVSATTKPKDLDMIIESYSSLEFAHIIATKLDETAHFGSILSVLYKTKKPISFITNGQGVPEDFEIANVDKLIADSLK